MSYERVTLMFSLPRSMTQWWAWFFGHGCTALHDPLAHHSRPDGLKRDIDAIEGRVFVADTSAIFFHNQLIDALPGVQRLYNFRSPRDIMDSLYQQTGSDWQTLIADQSRRLVMHGWAPGARRIHYVAQAETAAQLVLDVCGEPFKGDVQEMLNTRIDVPLAQQYRDHYKTRSLMGYKE